MHLFLLLLTACDPDAKPQITMPDADGDGAPADVDCDDGNPDVHPGAVEICDLEDNDCDNTADEGVLSTFWFDEDGDGYGAGSDTILGCEAPAGTAANPDDCDDTLGSVYPGAEEVCNGVDDDCSGEIEAGYGVWHVDADGDGYGDPATGIESCTPPEGRILDGTDCDDANPAMNPGVEEVCDYDDDNCDGRADLGIVQVWHTDTDGDGYGHMTNVLETCDPPEGYVLDGTDCRPGDPEAFPGAAERCNDDDDDCDAEVDEDFELDGDGDWSDACGGTDCDDTNPDAHVGGTEVCGDGVDQDCSGSDLHCGYGGTIGLSGADAKVYAPSNYDAARLIEVADLTDDGVDDLVIATMYADSYSGGAFVIPGPVMGTSTMESAGYRIAGSRQTYAAGRSLGTGDVDGDGVIDLAIGAPDGTDKEWVIFGPITADMDLYADADIMFTGVGSTETGHGSDIADVNGDGVDDAIIGAYEDTAGGYASGTVYIQYGPLAAGDYTLRTDNDARLIGEYVSAYSGRYVRAGADVDGDGVGDILAVSPYASVTGPYSGSAYLVYGGVTGDFDMASADGKMHGEAPGDYAGEELAMGDVNGDGLADVVLGSYDTANGYAGAAYVIYGPASGEIDLGSADVILRGDAPSQYFGLGLAVADIDADGLGELLVGGIGDREGGRDSGAAWLFFGPVTGTLGPSDAGAKFTGEGGGDQVGEAVAFGDVDGNGELEVILGAPAENTGGASGGAAYVVYPQE